MESRGQNPCCQWPSTQETCSRGSSHFSGNSTAGPACRRTDWPKPSQDHQLQMQLTHASEGE